MTDTPEGDWSPEKEHKADDLMQTYLKKAVEFMDSKGQSLNESRLLGVASVPLPSISVRMIENGWVVGYMIGGRYSEVFAEVKNVGSVVWAAAQEIEKQFRTEVTA